MNIKRLLLWVGTGLFAASLHAQTPLALSGTAYVQGFDSVGKGLPPGWELDSAATATSKGFPMTFDTTRVGWTSTSGRGKNFAAKGGFATYAGTSSATQLAAANRCFGLRQTAATDSGVAYTLTLAHTAGLSALSLTFNLQSLDSGSGRTTTWVVQYGLGSSPTAFTTVMPSAAFTTGGNTFASNSLTVAFGNALDNKTTPVVLRIASLTKTTGAGNRASTGIDSLTLSWTGVAVAAPRPIVTALSPGNGAAGVPVNAALAVTFDRQIAQGTAGSVRIRNTTDGTVLTKPWNSPDITYAGKTATVSNAGLLAGKSYSVTFDSTVFDSGAYHSYGLYDSTQWTFATVTGPLTVTALNENFSAGCAAGGLPTGWSQQNVAGSQQWTCYSTSTGNAKLEMYGAGAANEDWLLTPRLDLHGYAAPGLRFEMNKRFTGAELQVLVSPAYDGVSAPASASWSVLNIPMTAADTSLSSYKAYDADLSAYKATPFYLAFKYTSAAGSGYRVRLDTVTVTGTNGVAAAAAASLPVVVLGPATRDAVTIGFTAPQAGAYAVDLLDGTGRTVARQPILAVPGAWSRVTLHPAAASGGLYLVRVAGPGGWGVAKAVVD